MEGGGVTEHFFMLPHHSQHYKKKCPASLHSFCENIVLLSSCMHYPFEECLWGVNICYAPLWTVDIFWCPPPSPFFSPQPYLPNAPLSSSKMADSSILFFNSHSARNWVQHYTLKNVFTLYHIIHVPNHFGWCSISCKLVTSWGSSMHMWYGDL